MRQAALEDGFSQFYIDPHGIAKHTAAKLTAMMDTYEEEFTSYVAPYTSLVQSSMMGKSRLMKEISRIIPSVYICLRDASGSSGYPHRTPRVADWINAGLQAHVASETFATDIEYQLPALKFATFFLSLLTQLDLLARDAHTLAHNYDLDVSNLGWMWEFFAEPQKQTPKYQPHKQLQLRVKKFWDQVVDDAASQFTDYLGRGPDQKGDPESFLKGDYVRNICKTYSRLQSTFSQWVSEPESFTLILLFDEARPLCEISAYDGLPLLDNSFFDPNGARHTLKVETKFPFTNFRALKRALRLLLFSSRTADETYPRLFGLFTDTSSRLSDFQPHPALHRSGRMYSEFAPGIRQFPPLYAFTSIDAHARILCDGPCLSDPAAVSDPERLIKFGRAGWYSMYSGKNVYNIRYYDIQKLAAVAGSKLLYLEGTSHLKLQEQLKDAGTKLSLGLSLRMLALLAVRLAIAAGPSTIEAGELVASHLAVLLSAETEHPFLKIGYPSEPILATVAALHLQTTGWDRPLMSLCNYIDSSVVDAGFRGELLTKIICLLTMDELLDTLQPQKSPKPSPKKRSSSQRGRQSRASSAPPEPSSSQLVSPSERISLSSERPGSQPHESEPLNYWRYTKPVRVSQFLDHLLVAPPEHRSFSAALISKYKELDVDEDKLNQFLNGWVFFNHFIRADVRISIELMARTWNRGAALMCKPCTDSFDFVIPVMLAQPGDETNFGPMFDDWTDEQIIEGCRWLTLILINSKNLHDRVSHDNDARGIAPKPANFDDKWKFDQSENIYLSILQEFGPEGDPGTIEILPRIRGRGPKRQIPVVLTGHGGETYKCLADLPSHHPQFQRRKLTQGAIKQLKQRVEFAARGGDEDDIEYVSLQEGFVGRRKAKRRWRQDWKVMKQAMEGSDDIEMPDIGRAVKVPGLDEISEEEDQMDME